MSGGAEFCCCFILGLCMCRAKDGGRPEGSMLTMLVERVGMRGGGR